MKNSKSIPKNSEIVNEFKTQLTVVHKNIRATDSEIISLTIGRDAAEFTKRNPPKFDEKKENLIKFYNPGLAWLTKVFKA